MYFTVGNIDDMGMIPNAKVSHVIVSDRSSYSRLVIPDNLSNWVATRSNAGRSRNAVRPWPYAILAAMVKKNQLNMKLLFDTHFENSFVS